MSKYLDKQYVTIYAALGETKLSEGDDEARMEALRRMQVTAYAHVEKAWRTLPGRMQQDHEMESEVFELCDDDADIEEREGFIGHGICFVSHKNLPVEALAAMRDCVMQAYQKAGEEHSMSARLLGVERMNVLSVTETGPVDFTVPSPDIE